MDYFYHEQPFDKKVELALDSYRILKNSTNNSDQRLISLIDKEVRDLFDEMSNQGLLH